MAMGNDTVTVGANLQIVEKHTYYWVTAMVTELDGDMPVTHEEMLQLEVITYEVRVTTQVHPPDPPLLVNMQDQYESAIEAASQEL